MNELAIFPSLKGHTGIVAGGAFGVGAKDVRAVTMQGAKVGFEGDQSGSRQNALQHFKLRLCPLQNTIGIVKN